MEKVKDGLNFYSFRGKEYLSIESERLDEYLNYAEKHSIKNLHIDWFTEYWEKDLDFLKNKAFERLVIGLEQLEDVEALNYLPNLRSLFVGGKELMQVIDLKNSSKIEELAIPWNDKVTGKDKLPNLKYLSIGNLQRKSKNLENFGTFPNLKELAISGGNLKCLEGINDFPKLEILEIADLRGLDEFGQSSLDLNLLHKLSVINCKKLNFEKCYPLPSVRILELNEHGNIENLDWLPEKFPNLESFDFWKTKILSGDLSPLTELKSLREVRFIDEKGYNIKSDELKQALNENRKIQIVKRESTKSEPKKSELPTSDWTETGIHKELVVKVNGILTTFLGSLSSAKGKKQKLKVFELAVISLDVLQVSNGYFIDTLCREDLVDFFNDQAAEVGLDEYDDITWLYRKEW
jgi:hypothetical protein